MTSLVFGLVFVGLAGLWALVQGDLLSLPDASVVGPAVLVAAGVIGLAATLSGTARSRRRQQEAEAAYRHAHAQPVEEPATVPAAPRASHGTDETVVLDDGTEPDRER
ncbi:hypothetical protein [Angustibacter peucedani]